MLASGLQPTSPSLSYEDEASVVLFQIRVSLDDPSVKAAMREAVLAASETYATPMELRTEQPRTPQLLSEGQQSRRGSGGGGAASEEMPICRSGQAVPRLYLLGVPKCGTTSMASSLESIGAEFMDPDNKEGRFFDSLCGFSRFWVANVTGCPAPTADVLKALPEVFSKRNCSRQPTLLESTPSNFRLPGLRQLLSGFYSDQASRLGFILFFREPLARLHSHWWMQHSHLPDWWVGFLTNDTFRGYLSVQDDLTQVYKARDYEGMDLDIRVDLTYRSFYSLNLPGWLQAFASDQFLILPMMLFVNSTSSRDASLELIASKFGGTLSPSLIRGTEVVHLLNGSHPSLQDEVDEATVEYWYDEYFKPDLRRFAGLLAEHVPLGLTVAGYSGTGGGGAAAAEGMFTYICEALSCLA